MCRDTYYNAMILFTLISRVADGLPLVASVKEDTEVSFFLLWRLEKET